MNVLYIEDYAIDAELVRDALLRRAPDIRLDIVSSVEEAISRLNRFELAYPEKQTTVKTEDNYYSTSFGGIPRYDVVLTDLRLPDGSGMDVLSHVRKRSLMLAVVILTGSGEQETVFSALYAGADDYVTKRGDYLSALPATLHAAYKHFHEEFVRLSRTLRVLYAEPNDADADLTIRQLSRQAPHIQIEVVKGAGEVLARLASVHPGEEAIDVLLLDLRMPGMTAIDLVKELHQIQGMDLPVVLVTGHGSEELARTALKLGVYEYIVKSAGYLERLPFALENAYYRAANLRERLSLIKSERDFHSLADNLPDVITRFDQNNRHLYVNPVIETVTGLPASSFIGRTNAELGWPSEKVALWENAIQLAFASGQQQKIDFGFSGPNGDTYFDSLLVPEKDSRGKVMSVLVIARNITERWQAERVLREREQQLSVVTDHFPGQIARLDRDLRYVLVNAHYEHVFNIRPEKIIGMTVAELVGADYFARVQHHYQKALTGEQVVFEEDMNFCTEEEKYWLVTLIPDPTEKNTVQGLFITVIDITERKQHEKHIARLSQIQIVHGKINSAMLRTHERKELLEEVCQIIAEGADLGLVSVSLIDEAANQLVTAAWAGYAGVEINQHRIPLDTQNAHKGARLEAINTRAVVVMNDIDQNPDAGHLRYEAVNRGFRSVIALPLFVQGKVFGVLNAFSKDAAVGADEVRLMQDLVSDVSVALEYMDKAERIQYLAFHDTLTDLPNRTQFQERLSASNATSDGKMKAVALFDIARFRLINDSFGRQIGDEIIRLVAARLVGTGLPKEDLARLEGNTFGVILSGLAHQTQASTAIEQILNTVFNAPFRITGHELRLKAKCGALLYPVHASNAEMLLQQAGLALLNVKPTVESILFYRPDMDERSAEALELEGRLQRALTEEQFVLYYQPKLNVRDQSITSVEALIRWNDPETGLVPPGLFIPILEKTGMIFEVGRWVLRQAAMDFRDWVRRGLSAPRIAVNVSSLQLGHRDFVSTLQSIVSGSLSGGDHGIDLEITESVIMGDLDENIAKLKAARAMGMGIAVDDFGTGYSSLSYLSRLPVNALKIDRSFILEMASGEQGRLLVASIITLAHTLKLQVVAEGIETEEQMKILCDAGCDQVQGYFIGKPMPKADLEKLIAQI